MMRMSAHKSGIDCNTFRQVGGCDNISNSVHYERAANEQCSGTEMKKPLSLASSNAEYADPAQTLLFLDWDDMIFPTTDLIKGWKASMKVGVAEMPNKSAVALEPLLEEWRAVVYEYLSVACSVSDRCVIVTNSRRPWVENCIDRFAPNLKPLFRRAAGGIKVVYAEEALVASQQAHYAKCPCVGGIMAWWYSLPDDLDDIEANIAQQEKKLTDAKYQAMKIEAMKFYSRYPGQTWKNIISFGDMKHERDAVHQLSSYLASQPGQRLRTKALMLPREPKIGELTLGLGLSRMMLPAYVRYDGNIDLDLTSTNPMQTISEALNIPQLSKLKFPDEEDFEHVLDEVAVIVQNALF